MKWLKYLIIVLVAVVFTVIIAAVSTQSSDFDLNQSMVMDSSPENISEYISDLKTWSTWGPWNKIDTTIVTTYGEITKGKGANMSWTSMDGPGKITITEYAPSTSIKTVMDLGGAVANGYWNFEANDKGTRVTWGIKGKKDLMFKIYAMFTGFDKYMAEMQTKGLKGIEENIPEQSSTKKVVSSNFRISEISKFTMVEKTFIGYPHSGEMDMANIRKNLLIDMPNAGAFAKKNNFKDYIPGAVWSKWDEENNQVDYTIGLVVLNAKKMDKGMKKIILPAGKVLRISKWGPYGSGDKEAHEALNTYMVEKGLNQVLTWEEYVNDPAEVEPDEIRTNIYYAVK